ncbi:MAG TPA: flagellar assembly peptidoglycan hydrolase FlgJ [Cellvibrionaceae bacterium]
MATSSLPSAVSTAGDIYTDVNSVAKIKNVKDPQAALSKVSMQFESMFIGMMLKSMRQANAAFEEDGLFESKDSLFYRDMYDQQLSIELSKGRGIGIAKALERQLSPMVQKNNPQTAVKKADAISDESEEIHEHDIAAADWRRVVASLPPRLSPHKSEQAISAGEQVNYQEPMTHSDWLDPYLAPPPNVNQKPLDVNIKLTINSPQDFIDQLLPYARVAARQLGVNPLVLIAQAAMETGWGKRMVSDNGGNSSNNLFNIKANSAWNGDAVEVSTLEYKNGTPRKELAQFRQYSSLADSFKDYVSFLQNSPRYQSALAVANDAKQFLRELHGAGYATDPLYSQKIFSLFETIADGRYKKDED